MRAWLLKKSCVSAGRMPAVPGGIASNELQGCTVRVLVSICGEESPGAPFDSDQTNMSLKVGGWLGIRPRARRDAPLQSNDLVRSVMISNVDGADVDHTSTTFRKVVGRVSRRASDSD
jgi:hypothetical protein